MKVELTEVSLCSAIQSIKALQILTGEAISVKPTKLIIVPYPDETDLQFKLRCIAIKHLIEGIKR